MTTTAREREKASPPKDCSYEWAKTAQLKPVVGWADDGTVFEYAISPLNYVLMKFRSRQLMEQAVCRAAITQYKLRDAHFYQSPLLLDNDESSLTIFLRFASLQDARKKATSNMTIRVGNPSDTVYEVVIRRIIPVSAARPRGEAGCGATLQ
jgi:hypothetical protein